MGIQYLTSIIVLWRIDGRVEPCNERVTHYDRRVSPYDRR